jgi:riboflavin transporter 2
MDVCNNVYITGILVVVFGSGSWLAVNGIWAEIPVLWSKAPERESLAPILTVTFQLANIGPLIFLAIRLRHKRRRKLQSYSIIAMFVVGVISSVLLAVFWNKTNQIGGSEYSTALISISFMFALVDCTSSVTFLPFMALFPSHLNAFYFGEGLSGVVPSIIALAQGVYVSPDHKIENSSTQEFHNHNRSCDQGSIPIRFSVGTYFGILTVFVIFSMISFFLLNFYLLHEGHAHRQEQESSALMASVKFHSLLSDDTSSDDNGANISINMYTETQELFWSKKLIVLLFLELLISCIGNGLAPAVSSYAFSSYGNAAAVIIVNTGMISGSAIALIAVKFAWKNSLGKRVFITLAALVIIAIALIGYIIWLATTLNPPLKGHTEGTVLVAIINALVYITVMYCKVTIAKAANELMGEKALFGCGVTTQIGSLIGALTIFGATRAGVFPTPQNCLGV